MYIHYYPVDAQQMLAESEPVFIPEQGLALYRES